MLTEEQAGAIAMPDEHKLILALPGSGKSFSFVSLAEAILELRKSNNLLVITFTNASANEMKERLEKRLGRDKIRRATSSTFASLMLQQFKQISFGRKVLIGPEQYVFVKRALIAEGTDTDNIDLWVSEIERIGRDFYHRDDGSLLSRVFYRYIQILSDNRRYDLNMMSRELIIGINDGTVKPIPYKYILVDEYPV